MSVAVDQGWVRLI